MDQHNFAIKQASMHNFYMCICTIFTRQTAHNIYDSTMLDRLNKTSLHCKLINNNFSIIERTSHKQRVFLDYN